MFERLGVKEVKLLTNNPTKVEEMQKYHINVVERVPLEVGRNKYNNDYLNTKEIRMVYGSVRSDAHSMVTARWSLSRDDEHQERFCSSTHSPILPSAPMQ